MIIPLSLFSNSCCFSFDKKMSASFISFVRLGYRLYESKAPRLNYKVSQLFLVGHFIDFC